MYRMQPPFAVVTGATSEIGVALAHECAIRGFDLVLAADDPAVHAAAARLDADAIETDLATSAGLARLIATLADRPVNALVACIGCPLRGTFIDNDFARIRHAINVDIAGTVALVSRIARQMRLRGRGRILLADAVPSHPHAASAINLGTAAFIDRFAATLRAEFENSGVTIASLKAADAVPGGSEAGGSPAATIAEIAKAGFELMMRNDSRAGLRPLRERSSSPTSTVGSPVSGELGAAPVGSALPL